MSSDLRVALRIQANAGNSRREIQSLERDLRKAGKEGAKALADEAGKAGSALNRTAQSGAASYRIVRQVMRDAATQGSGVLRQDLQKTQAELKQLGQIGRQAAREVKAELAKTDREGVQPLARSVDQAETSFRRLAQNGGRHLRALKTAAATVRGEFDRLKGLGSSAQGQLAGLGLGFGVVSGLTGSAQLDRKLIRTQQTAGMSVAEREEWRMEGSRIAKAYGLDRADVDSGFNTLIASGVNYKASKKTADAIGQATAISGADSAVLGKAVVSGSSAFNIDLNREGAALGLLQKMIVAGRLGNAELENLADIFPKIGGAASAAGMSISQALAFTETLSTVEMQPDRLGTLAESTLRVFSNKPYRDQITKSSGVKFFNKDGSARNPLEVFSDLKSKYDKMSTDEQRAKFMGVVFKGMDQDVIRGMRIMLTGNRLGTFDDQSKKIAGSGAALDQDLKDNLNSSTAVGSRMKATLSEAIDRMARPLNQGFADFGSYLLDDLKLSGDQLLAGGVASAVGGYYAGRGAKAGAGALLNKALGGPETLKNLAVGKVLEQAAGVTSVFVTNWPSGFGGNPLGDVPSTERSRGNRGVGLLGWAGLVLGAAQLGGSSGALDDAARLRDTQRSKMLGEGERTYQSSYWRNRTALADQAPAGMSYAQRESWLSDNARRLAQQETGLTAAGTSVAATQNWAAGVANRLTAAALVPAGQGGTSGAAESRLAQLLGKPLVLELRVDSDLIHAEVERRVDIQMRRGS